MYKKTTIVKKTCTYEELLFDVESQFFLGNFGEWFDHVEHKGGDKLHTVVCRTPPTVSPLQFRESCICGNFGDFKVSGVKFTSTGEGWSSVLVDLIPEHTLVPPLLVTR